MSAEDVDEIIDYILAEVNLSVSNHDRTTTDASVNSTTMTLSVSLYFQGPMPILNDFTELPSSCSRSFQVIQVRRGTEKRRRRVSKGLPGTEDRSRPNHGRKSQTDSHGARRSLIRYIQNSPYAEVRAVVDNHDDPNMPASTFRSWVIGTIFIVTSQFSYLSFSSPYRGIGIGSNTAQLLCVLPALIHRK